MFTMVVIYANLISDEVDFSSLGSLQAAARLAKRREVVAIFGYNPAGELVYSWGVDVEA